MMDSNEKRGPYVLLSVVQAQLAGRMCKIWKRCPPLALVMAYGAFAGGVGTAKRKTERCKLNSRYRVAFTEIDSCRYQDYAKLS